MAVFQRSILAFALVLVGCPPSSSQNPPQADAAPPRSASAVATSPPPPATSAPAGEPLPAFATVKKIHLRQEQGGPSIRRCDGVQYEVEYDLAAATWVSRLCESEAKGPPGNEALSSKSGKLRSEAKTQLEQAYAKLYHETARGCGHDGGTATLTVTLEGGKVEKWVDENWGCKKPPPEIAVGLRDFVTLAMSLAHNEP